MRSITPTILLAALVGCGSSSKSIEPTTPARAEAPTDGERIAAVMALFEKMVVAFEPADGNCEAMAGRVLAFAETEDAEAFRRMSRDGEIEALVEAHRGEIERDYGALKERFVKTVRTCASDADFEQAIEKSKLFLKKRDDGTIIEEDEGEG